MAAVTTPQEKPPREVRYELRIEPGSESVLRLVAVPPTQLSLDLVGKRRNERTCTLKLQGTQTNLPPDTVCNVLFKTASDSADPREHTVVGVPMQIRGTACTIEVEVDVFEAGLFGKGASELTVVPDFPLAEGCTVSKPFEFDHPLRIDGFEPGKQVLFGKRFDLVPKRDKFFKGSQLRLSVFHSRDVKKGEKLKVAPETMRFATFDWAAHDEVKHWRIGCSEIEGSLLLSYLGARKDDYAYDLRLEVLQKSGEEEKRYLVWEKPRALWFKRPVLSGFALDSMSVHIKVDDIEPGFTLPIELSLWQWAVHTVSDVYEIPVMYRIGQPAYVEAPSSSFFLRLLFPGSKVERKNVFALLRIPKTLSGTDEYVPLSAVFDYNESQFLLFDDDQLWLEPARNPKAPRPKQQKTPKELATALASKELKFRPSRTPDFGAISVGVRDDKLLVSIKLIGDPSYWKAAAPVFSVHGQAADSSRELMSDPRGPASFQPEPQPPAEIMKLTPTPSEDNPRLYEALVPLTDKRLLGQKVSIRGKVSKPDAMLWQELVAAPPVFSIDYEGVPRFSELQMSFIELTDDTSNVQFRCRAHHMPNGGKDGAVLGFRVYEKFSTLPEPIALTSLQLRYDIAKGNGGYCDAQGLLRALVVDPEAVDRLKGEGRFRLEAYVISNGGKVFSHTVPVASMEFGGAPRSTSGKLIYESHKNVKPEFKNKVLAICSVLGLDPNYLMACMAFETGTTFSAKIQNFGQSQAYGLIQFTKAGAADLGKSLDELRAMTEVEQLDYVQLYMSRCIKAYGPLRTLADVYMAILCPAGIGQPDTYQCYKVGTRAYEKNKDLDKDPRNPGKSKGYITKQDATTKVQEAYEKGFSFMF